MRVGAPEVARELEGRTLAFVGCLFGFCLRYGGWLCLSSWSRGGASEEWTGKVATCVVRVLRGLRGPRGLRG